MVNSVHAHDGVRTHDQDDDKHGNLRNLDIFDDATNEISYSNTPCNDGDPPFTIGGTTYACIADFHHKGGRCGTPDMTSEQQALANQDFLTWAEMEEDIELLSDRIDWNKAVITIPTYVHVIHDGDIGRQFTYASNPGYIKNQIKIMNNDFRGDDSIFLPNSNGRSYERYTLTDANAKIQFCLAGTTATDKKEWYELNVESDDRRAMMQSLRRGGMETLNVYVNVPYFIDPNDGPINILGVSNFPTDTDLVLDGVTILNESMPGGSDSQNPYFEGDTLTHETGHWLNLRHTHHGSCDGPGDYMNLAPLSNNYVRIAAKESEATYQCPVDKNDCTNDSGKKNPIHSFMSYAQVSHYS